MIQPVITPPTPCTPILQRACSLEEARDLLERMKESWGKLEEDKKERLRRLLSE